MNELKKIWTDLPATVRLAIVGVGGYFVYLKIKGTIESLKGQAALDKAKREAAAKGQVASLSDYEYSQLARKIYNADGWPTDDEDAVYSALRRLKNDYDFVKLEEAFQDVNQTDMISYVKKFLDSSEIGNCNQILIKQGIKYRF